MQVVALKITSNINALIKDLFHNPPSYKTPVIPSWKPLVVSNVMVTKLSHRNYVKDSKVCLGDNCLVFEDLLSSNVDSMVAN